MWKHGIPNVWREWDSHGDWFSDIWGHYIGPVVRLGAKPRQMRVWMVVCTGTKHASREPVWTVVRGMLSFGLFAAAAHPTGKAAQWSTHGNPIATPTKWPLTLPMSPAVVWQ